jgi:hypothetical protein
LAREKRTITRDSVFRGTGAAAPPLAQGVTPQEATTRQTAVWLADAEVEWLDNQCQEIRRAGWRNITRSALIRAVIRSAMERSPNLVGVSGEQELAQRLTATAKE